MKKILTGAFILFFVAATAQDTTLKYPNFKLSEF